MLVSGVQQSDSVMYMYFFFRLFSIIDYYKINYKSLNTVGTLNSWRRKWQPTPAFLPGEFHGQRAWQATVLGVTKSWTQLSD